MTIKQQPIWMVPLEQNRTVSIPRRQLREAKWILIAREAEGLALQRAHPRHIRPIASVRRAKLGRLNLLTVTEGLTPLAKAEECLAAGEAEGIVPLRSVDCAKASLGVQ